MRDGEATPWPGRGHVAIFVRTLHLLDLDLLQDWPGITEHTFNARVSQQNMRIKGVEWALYRLFELYSPTESRDKLRPFFPPVTSLQSVNLRAALFRALTELKKAAVLPRDVILRKTMLDECKGERFEELLAAFATLVMRKVSTRMNQDLSLPEHVLSITNVQEPQYVPLLLAYRHSIQQVLQQRQQLEQQCATRQKHLDHLSQSISQRRADVLKEDTVIDTERRGAAVELLRGDWTGDTRWINTILYEGKAQPPIQDHSASTRNHLDDHENTPTGGLLFDLERRVKLQEDRLDKWRAFRESLPTQPVASFKDTSTVAGPAKALFSLDKHQSIVFGSHGSEDPSNSRHGLHGPFKTLLESMERELSVTASLLPKDTVSATLTRGLPRATVDEQPKYEFSPIQDDSDFVHHTPDKQSSSAGAAVLQNASPQGSSPNVGDISKIGPAESEFSWLNETREHSQDDTLPDPNPVPSLGHETLMDRTRKSMAALFSSDTGMSTESFDPPVSPSKVLMEREIDDTLSLGDISDRRRTLLERTRQSMAAAPRSHASAVKPRSKASRMSQLHPVNQFETPQKQAQTQSILPPSSNGSTPREKLFSDDADMSSVFKSRPKIAQSPALSPERSLLDDSFLARDMTILDIGSDDLNYSSD